MRVEMTAVRGLRFDDGTPVTAASGVAPLGDGWLVARDDATSAAWQRPGGVVPVRLFPPVEGHDSFSEAAGTKPLKPDLETASRAGDVLRWYQRGNRAAGVPSAGVEVSLADLVAALMGRADPGSVRLGTVHVLDLGEVAGVGLAVTDAVALPDGRELLSAAAEDTPNADDPELASPQLELTVILG